ncbi:OVARIAN TUMOR DOMAIN-containing deubiquitinating enzyme 4-like isoform X2 [Arachis hypogaea]|uniref:OVARIAN TUMOR DOMAIN-containing deubiquitinating enzyme 4-like isoform X2 n=1 Tax=Arachis hypogaea TaxID=3818 RepID=UPI003B20F53D
MPQSEKSFSNKLPIIWIPGDGRCLFRSVVYGACLRRREPSPSLNRQKELADDLRAKDKCESLTFGEENLNFLCPRMFYRCL